MKLILITGPTAVGKTDIALGLYPTLPIEIINGDVGQLYTPLTIGTAKPERPPSDWKHQPVPHHLFDIIDEPRNFTVTEYRERVLETAREIDGRNKIPVIVGGSGFYIRSLFYKPDGASSAGDSTGTWEELNRIDPLRASQLHRNDTYRIQRALDIWKQTGQLPSTFKPTLTPPGPYVCFLLTRDRAELYERINTRVHSMLKAGWIEETEKLLDTPWEQFLMKKKIIGYPAIIEYLRKKISYDAMVAQIQQETRNYAKKQITYFRSLCRDIACHTIDCTGKTDAAIIQEISILKENAHDFTN